MLKVNVKSHVVSETDDRKEICVTGEVAISGTGDRVAHELGFVLKKILTSTSGFEGAVILEEALSFALGNIDDDD